MDRTQLFKEICAKHPKVEISEPSPRIVEADTFMEEAVKIFDEIRFKRGIILSNAASFVNVYSFPTGFIQPMEERDRDLFALKWKEFFRDMKIRIDKLNSDLADFVDKTRGKVIFSIFKTKKDKLDEMSVFIDIVTFRSEITSYLLDYLSDSVNMLDSLIKARTNVDRKRQAAFRFEPIVAQEGKKKYALKAPPKLVTRPPEQKLKPKPKEQRGSSYSYDDDLPSSTSMNDLMAENELVAHELYNHLEIVQKTAQTAQEISELSQILLTQIVEQKEKTDLISYLTDTSQDLVKDGTRFIKKASKRWSIRRWFAYLYIFLSLSLLLKEFL
ncbi:Syntaxin 18 [Monocercomonoides exilis]|uniref:Syntaxin 18 n=1 Tax=Monocercomonoides exilis TaxID=2049356 RepID=UPI00355A73DD|nr:Syntaxin 18 [Monocercomonoides exilis]|eukprot:MONOS_9729.1-p1 / transcript=MONOS_9729.1 / gene=MONOS_9729 / organism=Monocercomonoides_exilis_PA203 / gene_product= Syntaxin 18 / transcript_product= Syntaxin 18 / location=Mono_scaffold00413:9698-10903(-) / protein_length=329 / sequence_SO=supercontig / SO=protein_coding / is_pseudo=false